MVHLQRTNRERAKHNRSDHHKLIGAREWLEGMRKVHDTLSFRKKQIQEVMTRLFDDKNDSWKPKVKPESRDIWIVCNTRRVWEACRDYGNALRRKGGAPSWVALMATAEVKNDDAKTDDGEHAVDGKPLDENDNDEEEEKNKKKEDEKKKKKTSQTGFHYGWEEENRTAWRAPFEAPTARQYPTGNPRVENDQLVVSFMEKDGTMTKHVIREVSVADFKEMNKVDWETSRGPLGILPMGFDKKGKPTVALDIHKKQVKDVGDVLLLFRIEDLHLARAKQPRKQKLQICLKWLEEADVTVARKMGLEIMQEVAAKYLSDKDDDALDKHRDDAMKARGKNVPDKPGSQSKQKASIPAVEEEGSASKPQQKRRRKGGRNAHHAGRAKGGRGGARPRKQASEDEEQAAGEGGTQ